MGPIMGASFPVSTVLGVSILLLCLRLTLSLTAVRLSADLTARTTAAQRDDLASAYLSSSWAVLQAEPSGRLQELISGFVARASTATLALVQGLTAFLSLIAFLASGALVQPVATVAMLAVLGLLALVMAPIRRRIRVRSRKLADSNLDFARSISELGSLGLEMQVFGVRRQFLHSLRKFSESQIEQVRQVQTLSNALTPLYTFFAYGAVLGGMLTLGSLSTANVGEIGAVMLLLLRSLTYGQQLVGVQATLTTTGPFLDRLQEALAQYKANPAPAGSARPSHFGDIRLEGVSLSYSPSRPPALSDLDLVIHRGEMLGVIGASGAGKSSLAQVLLGLRTPTSGRITVAGVDLCELDRDWWSRQVSFVPQDAALMTGTVKENLAFMRDHVTPDEMKLAAAHANVLADIEKLPHGLDTYLGERGNQLSGGQRQRLSIARALVSDPQLLVLDEPTSALDGESEALVRQSLDSLKGSVTMVIIAHRMSTLDLCDRIAVIENGQLQDVASPAALKEKSEFYKRALERAGMI